MPTTSNTTESEALYFTSLENGLGLGGFEKESGGVKSGEIGVETPVSGVARARGETGTESAETPVLDGAMEVAFVFFRVQLSSPKHRMVNKIPRKESRLYNTWS